MEVVIIIGYLSAVVIGISLGLIGGGGSILTVPALVYLLHVSPVLATAYSLFVVGATSLAGSLAFMRKGLVNYKTALIFAIPSFIAVYLTRKFLVPAIPDTLFTINDFVLTKNISIMVFFALIMIAASISMIWRRDTNGSTSQQKNVTDKVRDRNSASGTNEQDLSGANQEKPLRLNFPLIAIEGALVGTLTGVVGAGGGFLIIPALVLFARLPMKIAVGTSLLIIAAKSLIGFLGDIGNQPIDWGFMLIFTALSLVGIFIGSWLSSKIHGRHLSTAFGWFVLVMGGYILVSEIFIS